MEEYVAYNSEWKNYKLCEAIKRVLCVTEETI